MAERSPFAGHVAVRYLALLALTMAFAVLAVSQQARVIHLGRRVEMLGRERADLADERRSLQCEISTLSHPTRVAEAVSALDAALLDPVALSQAAPAPRAASPASVVRRSR